MRRPQTAISQNMTADARVSADGRYRYKLSRRWQAGGLTLLMVLLNPSTADARQNDPTVRRCLGYAQGWGFNCLLVGNLFAYRSRWPRDLLTAADPVGPDNDQALLELAAAADLVVAGWGNHGQSLGRAAAVRRLLESYGWHALGWTKSGQPKHPLYLPGSARPQSWTA